MLILSAKSLPPIEAVPQLHQARLAACFLVQPGSDFGLFSLTL